MAIAQPGFGAGLAPRKPAGSVTRTALTGEPSQPSWWRDVYLLKGLEVHHQGYVIPDSIDVWDVVSNFTKSGWGQAVQWGHWGTFGASGSGCYVYVDSQQSLGVTVEILGGAGNCGNLPVH